MQEECPHGLTAAIACRGCAADIAALTASLASVTSEVERLKSEKDYDGKEVLAASLAELRKRMEAGDRVIEAAKEREGRR